MKAGIILKNCQDSIPRINHCSRKFLKYFLIFLGVLVLMILRRESQSYPEQKCPNFVGCIIPK